MKLYHYCSQQTFLSILSRNSFWCSALSLSNDTMEGRWVHRIFSEICEQQNLEAQYRSRVLELLAHLNDGFEGLGLCLSEHGDSLSQWRGYAQNAEGFCIGFSKKGLHELAASLNAEKRTGFVLIKVNYDYETQCQELEPTYQEIRKLIDTGAFRYSSLLTQPPTEEGRKKEEEDRHLAQQRIWMHLINLLPKLFEQKNPAFAEEQEWRVVSSFVKSIIDGIEFRSAGDRIVPYRSFEFQPDSGIIKEVILGPKNQTPSDIVEIALKRFGYEDVLVRKSNATYR